MSVAYAPSRPICNPNGQARRRSTTLFSPWRQSRSPRMMAGRRPRLGKGPGCRPAQTNDPSFRSDHIIVSGRRRRHAASPTRPTPISSTEAGSGTTTPAADTTTVPEYDVAPSPCAVMVMIAGVGSKPVKVNVPNPDRLNVPSVLLLGTVSEFVKLVSVNVASSATVPAWAAVWVTVRNGDTGSVGSISVLLFGV